jgi:hypothetical protein
MKWVEIQGRLAFDDLLRGDPNYLVVANRLPERLVSAHRAPSLRDGVLQRHLGGAG